MGFLDSGHLKKTYSFKLYTLSFWFTLLWSTDAFLFFRKVFFHCCFHFAKQSCSFASSRDFPGGSDGKESACNVGDLHRFLSWEDALEKEMVIHSSVLAWRIPRSEEPWAWQVTVHGLQRVGPRSCNSTPGYISRENFNFKGYMDPNIHCSTVYSSQDKEAT